MKIPAPSIGLLGSWRRWFRPGPGPCVCKHPGHVHDLTPLWGGPGACNLCDCKKHEPAPRPAEAL